VAINSERPKLWKKDILASVDLYNRWFMEFAPRTFRTERRKATNTVLDLFQKTENLNTIDASTIMQNPDIITALRMSTCPPIARDRLVGLSNVEKSLIATFESNRLPSRMNEKMLKKRIQAIVDTIATLLDVDLFPWIAKKVAPTDEELNRSAMVVADRLCGANSDPIIRNAQEARQLSKLSGFLQEKGYTKYDGAVLKDIRQMPEKTFGIRMNVNGVSNGHEVNIPVDMVVQPSRPLRTRVPLLIEAKSAGDFTNVNKRRKEEAQKYAQLKARHGDKIRYLLFLCGYFDSGYLGYEAAEGIDWVWEHRIIDLEKALK
jgi:hypothetical protein